MAPKKAEVVRGTLDLMILRTLELEPMHGYGIAQRIEQITGGTFEVSPGSFFPALSKLEQNGWIRGTWGTSENGRRARFYAITAAGKRELGQQIDRWEEMVAAIRKLFDATA